MCSSDRAAVVAVAVGGPAPAPTKSRKAWKKSGTTLGRGSGVLLLGAAALLVLGALFVVFSLLE